MSGEARRGGAGCGASPQLRKDRARDGGAERLAAGAGGAVLQGGPLTTTGCGLRVACGRGSEALGRARRSPAGRPQLVQQRQQAAGQARAPFLRRFAASLLGPPTWESLVAMRGRRVRKMRAGGAGAKPWHVASAPSSTAASMVEVLQGAADRCGLLLRAGSLEVSQVRRIAGIC